MKEFARNNMLSQFLIGRTFKFLGRICNFCHDMSTKFDEDSSTTVAFKARLKYYRSLQQRVLMLSNKVLVERQQGSRTNKFNKLYDAVDRLKSQVIREGKALMETVFKKKKPKVIDPFVQWHASEDKAEVSVNWMEDGDVTKNVKIGSIMVDVDAPGHVCREYCRRYLRDELNSRVGERFLLVAKGEGLPIVEEATKRIGQLAPQKFNAETREIEHTLTITANKDKNLEPLQIPVIKSEEMKRKEEEMEKKRLWSLVIEEKKYKEVEMPEDKKELLMKELTNAGAKPKKVSKCFNREGKLVSIVYNDTTRGMDVKARSAMKAIVDECLGIDTQGEHNFVIEGQVNTEKREEGGEGGAEGGGGGESKEGTGGQGQGEGEIRGAGEEGAGDSATVEASGGNEERKGGETIGGAVDEATAQGGGEGEEEGLEDWDEEVTGQTQGGGGGWEVYKDDEGYDYYYNAGTGVSQYEVPEGFGK